eukprot:symbB.v1.2.031569.t1/scaffold3637.1/size52925/7
MFQPEDARAPSVLSRKKTLHTVSPYSNWKQTVAYTDSLQWRVAFDQRAGNLPASSRRAKDMDSRISRESYGVTEARPPHPQAASLVLKRLPPRCTTAILIQVLDTICPARYDYIHLPLDHQTHKNMSLAFLNFADHEAAVRAFSFLSRPSDFPEAFAPSTKVVWGAIHGLGPNLAHFIARYGIRALDPPFAPLVFEDGVCVPRSQDILWQYVRSDMVRAAARFLEQRGGSVDLAAVQGWCRDGRGSATASAASFHPTPTTSRARKSMRELLEELSEIPSYTTHGHVVFQL